ncbi:DUF3037 domain-containing protein [Pedobacter nyackensis]|uniref:DUF3037 domain-containing protein n=1 Tax=Pedobacter nyackensis TaxID=475255 RepID=A0A1W2EL11_9SPHI|nr:DUF3037 domain-containing protein [Pedobacter nyackensis]SMD09976.1 Protein of unknown function [Pedobacter nyackensis]
MQEKDLFEYAVIRVVPRVEREEFMNVGVVVYCAKQKFLDVLIKLDQEKLAVFCKELDPSVLEENLNAFKRICAGGKHSGPIGQLDAPSRFRWLTATRSTVIQTSRAHAGLSSDAKETLFKLYTEMVL